MQAIDDELRNKIAKVDRGQRCGAIVAKPASIGRYIPIRSLVRERSREEVLTRADGGFLVEAAYCIISQYSSPSVCDPACHEIYGQ